MMLRSALCALLASSYLISTAEAHNTSSTASAVVNDESSYEWLLSKALYSTEEGLFTIDIRVLNLSDQEQHLSAPDTITGVLSDRTPIFLRKAEGSAQLISVAQNGFATIRYSAASDAIPPGYLVSIPALSSQRVMVQTEAQSPHKIAHHNTELAMQRPATSASIHSQATPSSQPSHHTQDESLWGNLSTYKPIYMAYGPTQDTEAKVQLSLRYRVFGNTQSPTTAWSEGLYFGYTQRMYSDISAPSTPFHDISYMPEVFYQTQAHQISDSIKFATRFGVHHESNGRDGIESRSLNTFYLAPMAEIALFTNYTLTISPRYNLHFGSLSDNPDIQYYRGRTSLGLTLGKEDGLKIATESRLNFGSGKGAFSADITYPLDKIIGTRTNIYLLSQLYTGYGETMLDYNQRNARLRFGIAFTR